MSVKITLYLEKISNTFWVIPSLLTLLISSILFPLKAMNVESTNLLLQELFLLRASADGARIILGSIATSVMTVVGVLFSITIVVLQQVSTQYTPRVITNFTRSAMSQTVLGLYVGTFVYSLLLLSNIGDKQKGSEALPQVALSFGVFLSILCLLFLIVFINHVSQMIQSTEIVSRVRKETIHTLNNMRTDLEEYSEADRELPLSAVQTLEVRACVGGYLEALDWKQLMRDLKSESWSVEFHVNTGDYVHLGFLIMTVRSSEVLSKSERDFDKYYNIETLRTNAQDPLFGLQKLSDVALKALSPGINDPSTAIEALHCICAVLLVVAVYPDKCHVSCGPQKTIKFKPLPFRRFLEQAYDQVIAFSHNHSLVIDRMILDLRTLRQSCDVEKFPDIDLRLAKLEGLKLAFHANHPYTNRVGLTTLPSEKSH